MNRITFTTPPNWPDPPEGFLPGPDWRPDPAWGPAPAGFQFYSDAFGYYTAPPADCWQPWTSTDWSTAGSHPVARVIEEATPGTGITTNPAPVGRRRRRWPWLVGVLALMAALVGGWFAWRAVHSAPTPTHDVSSVAKLYDPALAVGATQYQFAQKMPAKVFEGSDACIAKANAAVAGSKETVGAGTQSGWTAITWRFADTATAQKAQTALVSAVNGCKANDYKMTNPKQSPKSAEKWVQYDQTSTDGSDHGRVVLTTDANTVTYIEGGRTDMGETAWNALHKRLATLS